MGVSATLWLVYFLSALHAHTVGICVLSALYVDSDVAASFSSQYTARFKIIRPWFCSRLFLLFSLSRFSCVAPYGFQEISLWKCLPRSCLAGCQRLFGNKVLKWWLKTYGIHYLFSLQKLLRCSSLCPEAGTKALWSLGETSVKSALLCASGLVTSCWRDLNSCGHVLRVQVCGDHCSL